MTEKRYVCFVCYKFHPEMRGVPEKDFDMGNNVCTQEECDKLLPFSSIHEHK